MSRRYKFIRPARVVVNRVRDDLYECHVVQYRPNLAVGMAAPIVVGRFGTTWVTWRGVGTGTRWIRESATLDEAKRVARTWATRLTQKVARAYVRAEDRRQAAQEGRS